jgi:hypothetical protein
LKHIIDDHPAEVAGPTINDTYCSICACRPGGTSTYISVNYYEHMKIAHGLEKSGKVNNSIEMRWSCPDKAKAKRV